MKWYNVIQTEIIISGFYHVDHEYLRDIHEDGFEWVMVSNNIARGGNASEISNLDVCTIDEMELLFPLFQERDKILVKIPEDKKIWFILKYSSITLVEDFHLDEVEVDKKDAG